MKSKLVHALTWLAMPFTSMAAEAPDPSATEDPATIQTDIQDDWTANLGTGVQIGGQGIGAHLSYNLLPSLYFKMEGNYAGYEDSITVDSIDYDGEIDFSNFGITTNYLPFGESGFKIIGGIFFSPSTIDGTASAEGEKIGLGDNTYTFKKNDAIHASLEYNVVVPYIGIGWDWVFGESQNYVIAMDLGVSYLGDPDVTMTGTGQFADKSIQSDINKEEAKLRSDAEDYTFLPTMKLSFTYRF